MSAALIVEEAGPAMTLQDLGRPGHLAEGLSPGGAMDVAALHEGAALLGVPPGGAAIEMGGMGGRFRLTTPARIALTGAPMRARAGGATLRWNAVHAMETGTVLEIGGCLAGQYGYLSLGGGIATPEVMGSRSVHTRAGIGAPLRAGDRLPLGPDPAPGRAGLCLPDEDRFTGGLLRVLPSAQTARFPADMRARFEATEFKRAPRGSRLGVALAAEGAGFALPEALTLLSEVTLAGDVQITGDGTPFLLLADCQTTGGYPRIACILPMDLPRAAQAAPGAALRFRFVEAEAAQTLHRRWRRELALLPARCAPVIRDPGDMADLLTAQLISGVTDGGELS
ncbi:MAG: urea amidolyase [Pseudomonadota bacterium]